MKKNFAFTSVIITGLLIFAVGCGKKGGPRNVRSLYSPFDCLLDEGVYQGGRPSSDHSGEWFTMYKLGGSREDLRHLERYKEGKKDPNIGKYYISEIIDHNEGIEESFNGLVFDNYKTDFEEYMSNKDSLKLFGLIKNGFRDSVWTTWYKNGQKKEEATYKDGVIDGLYTSWWDNGNKKDEIPFKAGEYVMKDNFKPVRWINGKFNAWHENGQKRFEYENYTGGFWHRSNHMNNVRGSSKYSAVFDGKAVEWYPNGKKKLESIYKDGELVEENFTDFYDNGNKKIERIFSLDNSPYTVKQIYYYSDGKKKREGETEKGMKDGVWTYYYKGKTYKMNWKDDKPFKGKVITWVSKDTPPYDRVYENSSWKRKLFSEDDLWNQSALQDGRYNWKSGVRMTEVYQRESSNRGESSITEVEDFKEWNEDGELINWKGKRD